VHFFQLHEQVRGSSNRRGATERAKPVDQIGRRCRYGPPRANFARLIRKPTFGGQCHDENDRGYVCSSGRRVLDILFGKQTSGAE